MSLSSNLEKKISSYSSEVLEDVNKQDKDVLDILNRETNRVRKKMEALDEAAKKLEHVYLSEITALERHLTLFPSAFLFEHGKAFIAVLICVTVKFIFRRRFSWNSESRI